MIAFIDDHREVHGVEPICKVLPIICITHLRLHKTPFLGVHETGSRPLHPTIAKLSNHANITSKRDVGGELP